MQPWINGRFLILSSIVLAIIAWSRVTAGTVGDPTAVEVQRGSVTFDVGTNLLSLSVHGTSDVLNASADLQEGNEGLSLAEYGIPAPSQLGVRTGEDVKVDLDFMARPGVPVSTSGRGRRGAR